MEKYLVKREAIINGIKDISYIGGNFSCYENISYFSLEQFFTRKNVANACMHRLMYGSLNCKVLNVEVIEVK